MSALATNGETTTVAQTLVATDFHLALDVLRHLAAQIALDLKVGVDVAADLGDFVVRQIANTGGVLTLGRTFISLPAASCGRCVLQRGRRLCSESGGFTCSDR